MANIIKKKNVVIVYLAGDVIVSLELKALQIDLAAAFSGEHKNVILNFERTEYISAGGVELIVSFLKKARKEKGDIKFLKVNEHIKKLLQIVGVIKFVECFEEEKEALASFNESVSVMEKNLLWE